MTPAQKRTHMRALAAFIPDPPPAGVTGRQKWHNNPEPSIAGTRRALLALHELASELGIDTGDVFDFPAPETPR